MRLVRNASRWLIGCALALAACSTNTTKAGLPDAGADGGSDAGPLAAPTVASIVPSSGSADGGTPFTVAGANFVTGAIVRVGGAAASNVSFINATRITGQTPPGVAGKADVVVVNPDLQLGRLTQAFTYTSQPPPPSVTWCILQFPQQGSAIAGSSETFYGRVFAQGVTDQVGQGAGIAMQFGIGASAGALTWTNATFNTDTDSNANDEYQFQLANLAVGTYLTAFRAQLNGGAYTYCEVDGPHAALDAANLGTLTVTTTPPPVVTFCDLNLPQNSVDIPGSSVDYYGEVFQPGVTTLATQGPNVVVQLGVGQPDGGGFTWFPTSWNGKQPGQPNNDEYKATLLANPPGTYGTAFRASLDGGPFTYCELDGGHAALDPSALGSLTVQGKVDYCVLDSPADAGGYAGGYLQANGRVFHAGLTDLAPGQASGITLQAGMGPTDGGPYGWVPAGYVGKGGAGNHDDRYSAVLPIPATAGAYRLLYRSMLGDGGVWTYCETDGEHDLLDVTKAGNLIALPPPTAIANCVAAPVDPSTGVFNPTVFVGAPIEIAGGVIIPGWTGQPGGGAAAGVVLEASADVQPDGGGAWLPATFASSASGEDVYLWNGVAGDAGVHLAAMRAKVNGGAWSFCESAYSGAVFVPADAGTVTVRANTVDYCRLDGVSKSTGYSGDPYSVTGEVYAAGLTGSGHDPGSLVSMQAGVGQPDGGGFIWSPATWTGVVGGNNDQYVFNGSMPPSRAYAVAMRAQLRDGGYTLCELNGPEPTFDPADAGPLVVQSLFIDGCNIQYPQYSVDTTTFAAGQPAAYYGQVYVAALAGTGRPVPYPGISSQVGVGPLSSDPSVSLTGWRFFDASYNTSSGNNDEYTYSLGLAANQTDALVFRFSGDGKQSWTYCDQGFNAGGFSSGRLSQYSTQSNPDYSACQLLRSTFTSTDAGVLVQAQVSTLDGGSDYPVAASQALYGPAGTDPGGAGWTAVDAQYDGGDIHSGGSVWAATVQAPPGTYGVAFRFGLYNNSGHWWSYAGADGGCAQGFQTAAEGQLVVH